jgi:hypothetical protein
MRSAIADAACASSVHARHGVLARPVVPSRLQAGALLCKVRQALLSRELWKHGPRSITCTMQLTRSTHASLSCEQAPASAGDHAAGDPASVLLVEQARPAGSSEGQGQASTSSSSNSSSSSDAGRSGTRRARMHATHVLQPAMYLTSCLRNCSSDAQMSLLLQEHLESLNHIHVSAALVRLAHLRSDAAQEAPPLEPQLQQLLLGLLSKQLGSYTSRQCANSLWALSKLSLQPDPELRSRLLQASLSTLQSASTQEIANSVYAAALLGWSPGAAWASGFMLACGQRWESFGRGELSMMLWAAGTMGWEGLTGSSLRSSASFATAGLSFSQGAAAATMRAPPHKGSAAVLWLKQLLAVHARALGRHAWGSPDDGMLPQELANSMWALARLGIAPARAWVCEAVAAAGRCMDRFGSQELSNLTWALARLPRAPGAPLPLTVRVSLPSEPSEPWTSDVTTSAEAAAAAERQRAAVFDLAYRSLQAARRLCVAGRMELRHATLTCYACSLLPRSSVPSGWWGDMVRGILLHATPRLPSVDGNCSSSNRAGNSGSSADGSSARAAAAGADAARAGALSEADAEAAVQNLSPLEASVLLLGLARSARDTPTQQQVPSSTSHGSSSSSSSNGSSSSSSSNGSSSSSINEASSSSNGGGGAASLNARSLGLALLHRASQQGEGMQARHMVVLLWCAERLRLRPPLSFMATLQRATYAAR